MKRGLGIVARAAVVVGALSLVTVGAGTAGAQQEAAPAAPSPLFFATVGTCAPGPAACNVASYATDRTSGESAFAVIVSTTVATPLVLYRNPHAGTGLYNLGTQPGVVKNIRFCVRVYTVKSFDVSAPALRCAKVSSATGKIVYG